MRVLLLACRRAREMNETLGSLHAAGVRDIVVSLDCESPETDELIAAWRLRNPCLEARSSHQRFHRETGDGARMTDERVSRHWLNAVSSTFARDPGLDFVVYLEDDHVVAPGFWNAAEWIVHYGESLCPDCFSYNLGCHGDCWGYRTTDHGSVIRMESGNMGVVYKRATFARFLSKAAAFCDMLGSWDINVHAMQSMGLVEHSTLTLLDSEVVHLPTCTSSRTGQTSRHCDWSHAKRILSKSPFDPSLSPIDRGSVRHKTGIRPVRYARADDATARRCAESIVHFEGP
jgi:hypothetical protein